MAKAGVRVTGSLAAAIKQHGRDIQTKVLRSGAHAGAVVFYDEMKQRAPVDEGTLFGSIYRFHDESKSKGGLQRYLIGPNRKKAPHWHLVEYGHWRVNVVVRLPNGQIKATTERLQDPVWVPPVPYIRPTFDAVAQRAIESARERMKQRLQELTNGAGDGD